MTGRIAHRTLCSLVVAAALLLHHGASAADPVIALEVGGARLLLDESNVEEVRLVRDKFGQDTVQLDLVPSAARALEKMTETNIGREMHIRYGDRIVLSAVIQEAISGGSVVFSGVSREEAEAIVLKLN